jgi:signal transduction histidine kinase
VSTLRLQVGAIVFAMLALNAACLWWLGWLTSTAPSALVAPLSVAVVMAGLAQLVLRPLAEDFAALRDNDVGARLPTPRVGEMAELFEAIALLRERSFELEALEGETRRLVEDAERMRVAFVAAMGHDLRGPLNAIVGFADLLVMAGEDEVGGEQKQSVAIIRRSAQDLLFLLDQILDWARFEAGRISLERAPVELAQLLPQVAREAEQRSDDRGMRARVHVADGLPTLSLDPLRIGQALHGLLDHAARAPSGPQVELRAWHSGDGEDSHAAGVRLSVRDPGLSIRQADHDTFFEAFRPSYAPGGKRIAGLGLGPALARVLVRAHGGDVWFESRPDTGTTFTIALPDATSSAATP